MHCLSPILNCLCPDPCQRSEQRDLELTATFSSEAMRIKRVVLGIIPGWGPVPSYSATPPIKEEPLLKKVRFSSELSGVLIPTRHEIKNDYADGESLVSVLWYTKKEEDVFKEEFKEEVRSLVTSDGLSWSEAKTRLYQPEPTSPQS